MEAIIILSIGTILMLIVAWIKPAEERAPYLITALIFLLLLGSHKIFNPTLQEDFHQTEKQIQKLEE
jgi:hypothetical protein